MEQRIQKDTEVENLRPKLDRNELKFRQSAIEILSENAEMASLSMTTARDTSNWWTMENFIPNDRNNLTNEISSFIQQRTISKSTEKLKTLLSSKSLDIVNCEDKECF